MASDRDIEFWQKAFEGAPALTVAPTDRSRPTAVNPQHYGNVTQQISGGWVNDIFQGTSPRGLEGKLVTLWQVCAHPSGYRSRDHKGIFTDWLTAWHGTYTLNLMGLLSCTVAAPCCLTLH